MHYKPPRSSQADASELRTTDIYHTPYCTKPIHFCLRKADSETTPTPVGRPPVSVCVSVYVEPPYFAPVRVCYVNNDLAKESCCSQGADQFLHLLCNECVTKIRQTSEIGTTSLQGTKVISPKCPYLRGSTVCHFPLSRGPHFFDVTTISLPLSLSLSLSLSPSLSLSLPLSLSGVQREKEAEAAEKVVGTAEVQPQTRSSVSLSWSRSLLRPPHCPQLLHWCVCVCV